MRRLKAVADERRRPVPALIPRIALRLTPEMITAPGRLAGEGAIDQITDDLERLRLLGAETVVLDPASTDPDAARHPEPAWQALASVAPRTRTEHQ